ncbi:MAG: hypothetical protein ABR501_01915 [Pyrinomonadaceae bacterium]
MAQSDLGSQPKGSSIDGVYKFISRTTSLTAPQQSTEKITSAERYGIWIFQNGYFSQTRAKIDRTGWPPGRFPENPDGIGFDGGSGTFSSNGNTIELKYHTSFYPGRTGTMETLRFKLENETLTLTEEMAPHIESLATGERVTVLKRIG